MTGKTTSAPRTGAAPAPGDDTGPLLSVTGLSGAFHTAHGSTQVLHDVTFDVPRGGITAVVGETGSGKSLSVLTVMGLMPPGLAVQGSVRFDGRELIGLGEDGYRELRGNQIAMVFQDARSSLNPVLTVGRQLAAVARLHRGVGRKEAEELVADTLARVRIPDPRRRMAQYPHQFSGGMAQRAMIAMALLCRPRLMLLDEPTTGLDVTTQADVMELVVELARQDGLTACLVTHDLGVVGETCDRVIVMRHGRVVEEAAAEAFFRAPESAYARTLLAANRIDEAPGSPT
ncbi:ABC transporter ATP-binding protein [Streptomyces avicenniae]|uniref:ABC transporter ATP-binding protein n=1 Tax=Streptomyces avicenniae TaxID=500153 RepID=UPI00069AD62A|nr:ABC transporter ATP-binding protein [Streptomyces avicenniae]